MALIHCSVCGQHVNGFITEPGPGRIEVTVNPHQCPPSQLDAYQKALRVAAEKYQDYGKFYMDVKALIRIMEGGDA